MKNKEKEVINVFVCHTKRPQTVSIKSMNLKYTGVTFMQKYISYYRR